MLALLVRETIVGGGNLQLMVSSSPGSMSRKAMAAVASVFSENRMNELWRELFNIAVPG